MGTQPNKSLHLLRALLREASYLPDAVARQYYRRYIVGRFKAYQPAQDGTDSAIDKYRHRSFKRRNVNIIAERTSILQKKARKGVQYLRRANQGELPCLQKVLFFAYGRIGRRKYALLDNVLKPSPIADGDALLPPPDFEGPAPLQQLYYSNRRYLQYFDAPKPASDGNNLIIEISNRYSHLRTTLKSQYQRSVSINRELKAPVLKTPKYNVWMRPMPIKRARNNVRRWYIETMTRLLPPLPSEEWNKMHAMIHGEEKISLVKRRVPVASATAGEEVDPTLKAISEGLKLDKLNKADRPKGIERPHHITPKFMRRLYSRILQLCCKVEYDQQRKQWVAVWGEGIQRISPGIYQSPSDPSLFAGVDVKGQKLKAPKEIQSENKIQPRNGKGEYMRFPFYTEYLPENHPLRQELCAWKRRRETSGGVDKNSQFRGR